MRFHDPAHYQAPSACGRKVRDVARWDSPAARLVHAREEFTRLDPLWPEQLRQLIVSESAVFRPIIEKAGLIEK